MTKLIVMLLAVLLSSKDFEIRELGTNLLYSLSEKLDIDEAIIETYKDSTDVEVKDRLYKVYYDIPSHDYPDIHEIATYINSNYAYIKICDPQKWLEFTKGDKYKAGEYAWYDLIIVLSEEHERLMRCGNVNEHNTSLHFANEWLTNYRYQKKQLKSIQ